MLRRSFIPVILLALASAGSSSAAPASAKWPPWLSIESPVNPYDPSARGAAFLIHAAVREGVPALANLTGTAEGLIGGVRRSVVLRIDTTSRPGVFAVRKQWPADGTWLLRISLFSTTAIVSLDHAGNIGGVHIPTEMASGMQIPRGVLAHEIDSTLASASKR